MEIGEYSVVHPEAKIADSVKIGHHCVIEAGCEIGEDTVVEHFVLLKKDTKIGKKCFIDSYVRSSGANKIGDNVTLRFGTTVAREVLIKDGAFLSPNVMTIYVSHRGEQMPGIVIGKGAHIGTAAVLGASVEIGDDVVIGSMAYVSKSCLEPGIYVGIPAKKKS